jgi:NAD(P)-dependent dehydrogenase (short-subunit alcohol dehydrogenase family)
MSDAKRIFITGGTRGLGLCLSREFLKAGCPVFLTGRNLETARAASSSLAAETGGPAYAGAGDSGSWEDLERLAREAIDALGGIDVWVSNAGVNQGEGMVWELEPEDMERVVRTDFLGPMLAAKAAFAAMGESGGWLWFVEGHGSDGRIMAGLSAYGAAKRGIGYLWRALAAEAESAGSRLKVGAVSPGIMITDFTMDSLSRQGGERRKRTIAAFNVLADRPETVAAYLVPRMLAARRSGRRIAWLTGLKILVRFASAPFAKRRVIEG